MGWLPEAGLGAPANIDCNSLTMVPFDLFEPLQCSFNKKPSFYVDFQSLQTLCWAGRVRHAVTENRSRNLFFCWTGTVMVQIDRMESSLKSSSQNFNHLWMLYCLSQDVNSFRSLGFCASPDYPPPTVYLTQGDQFFFIFFRDVHAPHMCDLVCPARSAPPPPRKVHATQTRRDLRA